MASSAEETIVLTDASVEDDVRALLLGLDWDSPTAFERIEPATCWPGQELAIDLHGRDEDHLRALVAKVGAVLDEALPGLQHWTSAEYAKLYDGLPGVCLVITDAELVVPIRQAIKPLASEPFEVSIDVFYNHPGQEAEIQIYARDSDRVEELVRRVREVLAQEVGVIDAPTEAEYVRRTRESRP